MTIEIQPLPRWSTTLSSKVNLPHATASRGFCGAVASKLPLKLKEQETFIAHRAVLLLSRPLGRFGSRKPNTGQHLDLQKGPDSFRITAKELKDPDLQCRRLAAMSKRVSPQSGIGQRTMRLLNIRTPGAQVLPVSAYVRSSKNLKDLQDLK